MTATLICGNNVDVLSGYEDNLVDLTVTSPPYDGLREYKGYSFDFEGVAKQIYRVTKEGGILVWVVGDGTIKGSESGTSFKQALYFKDVCGFKLHDTMIYEKAGNLPTSNRYVQAFEYMFVFSKGNPKTANLIKDRENKWAGQSTFGKSSFRNKDGTLTVGKKRIVNDFGCRLNIWRYANGFGYGQSNKLAYQHPATFPEELAKDHIITWSNEGDLVLDPFVGSGTTVRIAEKFGRNSIGIDQSQEYIDLANRIMKGGK